MLSELARKSWSFLVAEGVLALALGILVMTYPNLTLRVLVVLLGIFWIVEGIVTLIGGFMSLKNHGLWAVFFGALSIVAGVVALRAPNAALAVIAIFLAFWFIVSGFFRIFGSYDLAKSEIEGTGWGWMLVSGIISILAGFVLFAQPLAGIHVLTWAIGLWAVVEGITIIIFAIVLRSKIKKDVEALTTPEEL